MEDHESAYEMMRLTTEAKVQAKIDEIKVAERRGAEKMLAAWKVYFGKFKEFENIPINYSNIWEIWGSLLPAGFPIKPGPNVYAEGVDPNEEIQLGDKDRSGNQAPVIPTPAEHSKPSTE